MRNLIYKFVSGVVLFSMFATVVTFHPQPLSDLSAAERTQLVEAKAQEELKKEEARKAEAKKAEAAKNKVNVAKAIPSRERNASSQVSRGSKETRSTTSPKNSVTKSTQPKSTTSKSTPKSTTSSSKASQVIATAKKYIGVPYVWGGTTPNGFDCSGFTQYVFKKHGISIPRVSRDQYTAGTSVSYKNLKAGDLVFFSLDGDGVIDHVGIFVGNGQFINASSSKGVTIYNLGSYWQSKYIGAKRVL